MKAAVVYCSSSSVIWILDNREHLSQQKAQNHIFYCQITSDSDNKDLSLQKDLLTKITAMSTRRGK